MNIIAVLRDNEFTHYKACTICLNVHYYELLGNNVFSKETERFCKINKLTAREVNAFLFCADN